jgi:hypothetical protein
MATEFDADWCRRMAEKEGDADISVLPPSGACPFCNGVGEIGIPGAPCDWCRGTGKHPLASPDSGEGRP